MAGERTEDSWTNSRDRGTKLTNVVIGKRHAEPALPT